MFNFDQTVFTETVYTNDPGAELFRKIRYVINVIVDDLVYTPAEKLTHWLDNKLFSNWHQVEASLPTEDTQPWTEPSH